MWIEMKAWNGLFIFIENLNIASNKINKENKMEEDEMKILLQSCILK